MNHTLQSANKIYTYFISFVLTNDLFQYYLILFILSKSSIQPLHVPLFLSKYLPTNSTYHGSLLSGQGY